MSARLTAGAKPFGEFDPKSIKITVPQQKEAGAQGGSGGKKKRAKLLIILYFIIGLILAIIKRSKRLFLIWPAMPFLKH